MKNNESYWINLYHNKKIDIDFDAGHVYSYLSGRNKHLLNCKHKLGYLQASAGTSRKNRNYILLHRLIWIAKYGKIPENLMINHKNGIKNDNRLDNLELVTKSGNAYHSIRVLGNKTGHLYGEKHPSSKITQSDVNMIRKLYHEDKIKVLELEKMFNLKQSQLYSIISGKSWKEGADHSCRVVGHNGDLQ